MTIRFDASSRRYTVLSKCLQNKYFIGKVLWCCRVNCDLRNTFREYMLVFTTITYQ